MPPRSRTFSERWCAGRVPCVLLVVSGLLGSGCYSYVPARVEQIEPGEAVRVRLSPEEADRLQTVRMTDARVMDGIMVHRSDAELLIETSVGRLDPMAGTRSLLQRVNVPFAEVREIERRQRDSIRTGAAIGGVALVVGVGVAAVLRGGSGQRPSDGEGPAEYRGPSFILRLPFRF
jgi:hypothetical protein